PDMSDVRPGDVVAIAWEARDDQPNPRIETSMDPTPVTIYFVDGSGRRTIAGEQFTSLKATGEMAITIPPVAGDSFTILVSAIDRAGNESDAADMQAHVRLGISRPKVPGVMLTSRAGDPKGKAHSFTWESGNDMPMENIDKLMLWVSMDKGMSWQMASEFLPNAPITYTAEKDGHYAWALTASSVFGLAEPPPSSSASIEQQVMLDWTPPMVELEVVGEQKDVYVVGDQPPMVRYRITDETFDPNKVRVEISTGEGGIPFDASRTVNGEWMAIPLTLSEGSISIRVTAIDDLGNQGEAQPLTLNVLGKGNWYFTSPAQSATWLTGTQLRLQWERAGAVAENGKVDLYYEEVRQSETGEWAAVGEPVVVKMGCPDIAQFGMYKQDKGVPSREMFVRYLLKTKDVRGMPQEARSAVVEIVKPTPVPSVRTDEEYIDGLKEHPATVVVRNASGGAYELPPKIVRLYYKYYAPGSDTPARDIWEWQAYEVKSGLEPGEVSRTLGTYDVAFVPTAGEGRYEIVPYFEDDLGNTSAPITMETQPEATLVFDAAPPVMTLEADIGPRPFYLANEIKQLYFTAMDATLKKDSLQFEIAKVSTNDWAMVDWVPMLDESRETATMIAGSVTPMFPDAERYLIRVSALDALGRRGYASLGGEFLADQGDYVAVQPVEAEDATERYTSKHYSRRGSFRIQVEARRPWGSGLKSLTLWWRKRSPTGESTPWNSTMFNEWRTVSGWQSLPFTAKESGDYEFIVGSESVRGQLEMDGAPEMDAEPELYVSVTVDDYLLTVEPLKPAPMPMTGPDRRAEQLAFNRLIPGAVYLLEWRIHSGIYTTETSFMMASGFAGKYEPAILIERSATAEPEINRYVAETMPRRKEGGRYTQERLMRCYWRCPESLANTNRADFHIKIIARESSDAMPEFRREAFSPRYMIGATPSADVERNLLYYRAKMEDGRRAMKKGEHATALRHFGDAKHEIDTAEVNLALAEAYEKLGEALKARHHRTHATTVSAPDTAQ
ncbi:MAG: hypothetical protein L6Q71_09245, partial [Planctomycetes bacterium]|nr:hypothetical protein [Planctomycetota bacterium]